MGVASMEFSQNIEKLTLTIMILSKLLPSISDLTPFPNKSLQHKIEASLNLILWCSKVVVA